MVAGALICAVTGHKWHVDETDTETEIVLACSRCGRKQLAPNATGLDTRVSAQTGADRALGPLRGGRR